MHRFLTQIFNIIVILIGEVRPQEDLGDVQDHFAQSLNLCLPWIEEAFDCGRFGLRIKKLRDEDKILFLQNFNHIDFYQSISKLAGM